MKQSFSALLAGSPISDWSNVWPIRYQNDLFLLKATIDHIPPEGGNIEYSVNYRLDFPFELNNVTFWTEITAPNGTTYGPLYSTTLDLTGHVEGLIEGLTQEIPPLAPPGVYTFTGNFGRPGLACLSSSFYVFKQGIGSEAVDMRLVDWPRETGPDLGRERDTSVAREFITPHEGKPGAAYPYPFNAVTAMHALYHEAEGIMRTDPTPWN